MGTFLTLLLELAKWPFNHSRKKEEGRTQAARDADSRTQTDAIVRDVAHAIEGSLPKLSCEVQYPDGSANVALKRIVVTLINSGSDPTTIEKGDVRLKFEKHPEYRKPEPLHGKTILGLKEKDVCTLNEKHTRMHPSGGDAGRIELICQTVYTRPHHTNGTHYSRHIYRPDGRFFEKEYEGTHPDRDEPHLRL